MKTYVLTVSKTFPATHKRKGEPTYFPEKIIKALDPLNVRICEEFGTDLTQKIHTIRANYDLWLWRIKEVQEGNAILSVRFWSGKPYNSKQVELCHLDKDSGIGVQKIFINGVYQFKIDDNELSWRVDELSNNDGLSESDFKEWFVNYELNPMAIIHFTKFRY